MNNKTYLRFFTVLFLMLGIILEASPMWVIADSEIEELLLDEKPVKVTMDLQEASLRDVLKMLSVQSGLNFIASEAVAERKLTLYLDNVPVRDAMDKIFKANNLAYELDSESNIFMVKDWGKPGLELDTRIYFLKYVRVANSRLNQGLSSSGSSTSSTSTSASTSSTGSTSAEAGTSAAINGLKEALNTVISEYGKIIEDPATNSMIITDMPSKFSIIEQLINRLDVPIPQVMIEVEILDVSKSAVDKLGIKFPQSFAQLDMTTAGRATGFPFGTTKSDFDSQGQTLGRSSTAGGWTVSSWAAAHFGPSIFSVINTQLALDFLKTISDTKFLARPKLFVLNNETAKLTLSSNEAIGSSANTQGQGQASITTTSAERAQTGVTLEVTPQISMTTGEITMILQPTVKEAVASNISLGVQPLRDVEERSVKSTVRVRDGETVIIGGLIRQKKPMVRTRVAFLSDIPILGMLFRHKDTAGSQDREILVFITPKIIKSSPDFTGAGRQLVPKMLGERKQDDFISTDRQEIVSQTLGRYEIKPLAK